MILRGARAVGFSRSLPLASVRFSSKRPKDPVSRKDSATMVVSAMSHATFKKIPAIHPSTWTLSRIWNEIRDFSVYFSKGSVAVFNHTWLAWHLRGEVCVVDATSC